MLRLAAILVGAALLLVVYHFYLKQMPSTDQGTAPTQAISLTGVRSDLLQIAQAERSFIALNGHCASLDELISSNSLSVPRTGRDGYTYSAQPSGDSFTITATYAAPPARNPTDVTPPHFPTFTVDQTMEVHQID